MPQYKTPGVYIVEKNAFPNSVVEVPTAVPAFIGYTERALQGTTSLLNRPTKISSLAEYELYFGSAPKPQYSFDKDTHALKADRKTQFYLYYSMRLFFDNGGGPCYIVSVGTYDSAKDGKDKEALVGALTELVREQEPTMIVVPDAVLLDHLDDWNAVSVQTLSHCNHMQSRVAILDVYDGKLKREPPSSDVVADFRDHGPTDFLNYGIAYYPWVKTGIVDDKDIDYTSFSADARPNLITFLKSRAENYVPKVDEKKDTNPKYSKLLDLIDKLGADNPDPKGIKQTHEALLSAHPDYGKVMTDLKADLNVLPPSGAMAGVYTRVDNNIGVFKAPANTGMASVVAPCVEITHDEQEDLNIPLDGKAINAIRTFPGRGVLIWGARTLDGNSQDWRYINVRRTMIMLEQSIKAAAAAYVFAPNNASTWVTVSNMIGNFLTNQWKAGALVGATPAEAFSVDVGLGSTMTANDILDGYMLVTVKVAVVHPAEFIIITFQQKMQTS